MQTNNAEVITESTEVTNESTNDTASTETSAANTEVNAIEEVKTSEGEQSSSTESAEQSTTDSDLYYDIDGEEVSASTVAEWRKGHMLQSDYTKKSQANAEIKKALEAKSAEIDGVKSKLSDYVSELESLITKDSNPEDLAELRDTDPSEYLRRKEEIADKQKIAEKAKKELADIQENQSKDKIANESKLLMEAIPDWQDPVKFKQDQETINEYLDAQGFSDDDVNSLVSHKLMIAVNDAAKYHKLQKDTGEVEKQVQKAPNVVKAKVKQTNKPTQSRAERFYGK